MRFPKKAHRVAVWTIGGLALGGSADVARAQCVASEQARVTASDAARWDEFGWSVAASGTRAVFGAHFTDDAGPDSGAAYVYVVDGTDWTEEAKLTASNAAAGDIFGTSVAISGTTIVVGAPRGDSAVIDGGSAYVFAFDGTSWIETGWLIASTATAMDDFGTSVAIAVSPGPPFPPPPASIVVGAPGAGAAYGYVVPSSGVFPVTTEAGTMIASDAPSDGFGTSVTISGDASTIVVGAPGARVGGATGAGQAYTYAPVSGITTETAILVASDPTLTALFGTSVSISTSASTGAFVLAIGAPSAGGAFGPFGAAYMFRGPGPAGFAEEAKLIGSDTSIDDRFGFSVSLRAPMVGGDDRVLIGSPLHERDWMQDAGAAYLFAYDGADWLQTAKLIASDGNVGSGHQFGVSVSYTSGRVAIGANRDTVMSPERVEAGAGYLFANLGDCNTNGEMDLCDAPDCNANGFPDECDIDPTDPDGNGQVSADCNGNTRPDECDLAECPPDDPFCDDCNDNGIPDECDVSAGTSPDCNGNGVLDECELADCLPGVPTCADCNTNGILDECDLADCLPGDPTCADCNTNGIPDECEPDCNTNGIADACDIAEGTSEDCNNNGIPDECDLASGTSADCDANGIPDECDPDCNSNGAPDACDLAAGTSADCNSNSIPDECDLASGTSADCNTNSIPDECDLASGTSEDCNTNGVPDECDVFLPWSEQFDRYADGSSLHGQGGWVGWDDDPAFTAFVTQHQARSGLQSVDISGDADLVHGHCTTGDGTWLYTAWQYIPGDFTSGGSDQFAGSYFILLNTYNDGGPHEASDWSVQLQFDSNDGELKAFHGDGTNTVNTSYVTDQWVEIRVIIDLDSEWTWIYYHDSLVVEYSWTGGVLGGGDGARDIGAVDLFANGSTSVYWDDLLLKTFASNPCGVNEPGAPSLAGDVDLDGDADLADFAQFQACFTGKDGGPVGGGCLCADIDQDGDVDLDDYDVFRATTTGPQP